MRVGELIKAEGGSAEMWRSAAPYHAPRILERKGSGSSMFHCLKQMRGFVMSKGGSAQSTADIYNARTMTQSYSGVTLKYFGYSLTGSAA